MMEKRIEALLVEVESLLAEAGEESALLDAYLYESRIRCGKTGCRCMTSEHRHSRWCLSYSRSGKSRTRTVRREALGEVRALCERYRALRGLRKRLLARVGEVVAALDRHIDKHASEGWDRFECIKESAR